ncbi:MAG: hypothetical protein JXQ30_02375 [Spirochaetes bacterium]|nr:hypothetical protein [Spirochaetota bacterium]
MRRFTRALFVLVLCCCLFAAGCATTVKREHKLVKRSHETQPSWISIIPSEPGYLFFVGTSGDSSSYDEGKKDAVSDALSFVVAAIGISVSSSLTYEERFFAEEYTAIVSRELLSSGRANLQDAEIVEAYHEEYERADGSVFFRVWVLLKYSRAEIRGEQERIEDILRLKYGEISRLEREAKEYGEKGELIQAVASRLNAAFFSLKVDDEGVFFDRNIQKAQELIAAIELEKSGDRQVGLVGEGLTKPLVLHVYTRSDAKKIPLSNAPVKFTYRVPKSRGSGYKLRVERTTTDADGKASLYLTRIYEVREANEVEAEIDLAPFFSARLDAVPARYSDRVEALQQLLGTKRVTFTFRSDSPAKSYQTAIFFLQTDEGRVVRKPSVAAALVEDLRRRGFSVFEIPTDPELFLYRDEYERIQYLKEKASQATQRIMIGEVRIVKYDRIAGFYTASAESVVRLYDAKQGFVLGTWQHPASGTGSSKEAARNNAFLEAGRRLGDLLSGSLP